QQSGCPVKLSALLNSKQPGPKQPGQKQPGQKQPVTELYPRVLASLPHDVKNFTQGLVIDDNHLYESTGHYGKSKVIKSQLNTGKILKQKSLEEQYFGEGLTLWGDKLYQVTYQERKGFVYDKNTLAQLAEFKLLGDGWGITHDDKHLIISDGSAFLSFLDPKTLQPVKKVKVTAKGEPVLDINELEYINGYLFANLWLTNHIAIINPVTGKVRAMLNLSKLVEKQSSNKQASELNGIAYNANDNTLWVTGKNWSSLYQICLDVKEPVNKVKLVNKAE
ncbi:MAG: glutaminyl-peptide cyclotransferase, partial [Algicola sp.]|nr:glutaminyl-peptide cyclotransferase [Algicola sp.]